MNNSVARVYLLDAPYHIDKLYDYYVPEDLRSVLTVGSFFMYRGRRGEGDTAVKRAHEGKGILYRN